MAAEEYTREARRIRRTLGAAVGLGLCALAAGLVARYAPTALPPPLRAGTSPQESGRLARVEDSGDLATASLAVAPHIAPPTGQPAALHALAQDTARRDTARTRRPRRARRRVPTDVVLLPCSMPNPRPDGGFVIPPHDPRHRTIVGLPSGPGEPRRGFIVPPHDPSRENDVAIQVIAMDSILDHMLIIPPHDPKGMNVVRPPALPCRPDSAAAGAP